MLHQILGEIGTAIIHSHQITPPDSRLAVLTGDNGEIWTAIIYSHQITPPDSRLAVLTDDKIYFQ